MSHRRIYDPRKAPRAAELRAALTFAEARLWKHALRAGSMKGYSFHRQWPMFGYIADFYCNPLKLVIEVDGPIHDTPEQVEHDRVRDAALHGKGMRILRLTNEDVIQHLQSAIEAIELVVEEIEREEGRSS
jgi:very-short-patch-repair endonuclease